MHDPCSLRQLPQRCTAPVPGPHSSSPLHPVKTTALVGLHTVRVGLMKTNNPHPLQQHCQHAPSGPSRRAGCEPLPQLPSPSQARSLTQDSTLPPIPLPSSLQAPASPKWSSSTACLPFPLCSPGTSSLFLAARGTASS